MNTQRFHNRYSRQQLFRPIGSEGQVRLGTARVAVVGMGALGTVAASQLARAGVGFLRLIDRDIIEPTNLQRQLLYEESDASEALPKAIVAAERLARANSEVTYDARVTDLTWRNAEALLTDVDVIVDATDNFQVRYLINDVAVKYGIPWSYGGAVSSYGTTAFIRPGKTPCLVCLFGPDVGGGHDTCDTVGVLAPVVSVVASLQVTEVLKYLTGNEASLCGGVTHVDVWRNEFRTVSGGVPGPDCPCCGQRAFSALEARADGLTVSLCGRRTIQVRPAAEGEVDLVQLAQRLGAVAEVRATAHLLRCVVDHVELTVFRDGRALIHGTDDESLARSIYARYIGM